MPSTGKSQKPSTPECLSSIQTPCISHGGKQGISGRKSLVSNTHSPFFPEAACQGEPLGSFRLVPRTSSDFAIQRMFRHSMLLLDECFPSTIHEYLRFGGFQFGQEALTPRRAEELGVSRRRKLAGIGPRKLRRCERFLPESCFLVRTAGVSVAHPNRTASLGKPRQPARKRQGWCQHAFVKSHAAPQPKTPSIAAPKTRHLRALVTKRPQVKTLRESYLSALPPSVEFKPRIACCWPQFMSESKQPARLVLFARAKN